MTDSHFKHQFLAYGAQLETARRLERERAISAREYDYGTRVSDPPLQVGSRETDLERIEREARELAEFMATESLPGALLDHPTTSVRASGESLLAKLGRATLTHNGECSIEDEEHMRRMAVARSKPKPTTAGAYGRDGDFAQAHREVFGSPQFRALGARTKVLLFHVNLHAYGSNGYIALSLSKLKADGFYSDSLREAIREALDCGFLRCLRQARPGQRGAGRVPAYYYPTWLRLPGEAEPPDTWANAPPKARRPARRRQTSEVQVPKAAFAG